MSLPAHYVCDWCQRVLESEDERFVFRKEANGETGECDVDDGKIDSDRDYLQEIDDLIVRGGELEAPRIMAEVQRPSEYHLCHECRQRFVPSSLDGLKTHRFELSNR